MAGFIVFVTIFTLTKNTSRIYSLPRNNCRTVPLRPSGHRICGKRKGREGAEAAAPLVSRSLATAASPVALHFAATATPQTHHTRAGRESVLASMTFANNRRLRAFPFQIHPQQAKRSTAPNPPKNSKYDDKSTKLE